MATDRLRQLDQEIPGNVVAVDRLDLEIRDNEFMVLLGPSGLRQDHDAQHDRWPRGADRRRRLVRRRRSMNCVPPHKRDVAMVFQSYALYPHKTVYENIAFGLRHAQGRRTPRSTPRPGRRRAARDHAPARAPAVRAVRRPAPARGARPRDRAQAVGVPDGRAAEQSRCRAARRHARADQAAASDHAHHVRVRHP